MKDISLEKIRNKAIRIGIACFICMMLVSATSCEQTDVPKDKETASQEDETAEIQTSETTENVNDNSEEAVTDEKGKPTEEPSKESEQETEMMKLEINGETVSVDWEENESVDTLKNLISEEPLLIQMSMYGGFEQVGSIGTELPRNDEQITTEAGDIVLYSGDQIVVFYGSNSWAYTRLGKIRDLSDKELRDLLENGDVTIKITIK